MMMPQRYSTILKDIQNIEKNVVIDVIRNFTLEPVFSDYLTWHSPEKSYKTRYHDLHSCFSETKPAHDAIVMLHLPYLNPSAYDDFYTLSKRKIYEEQEKTTQYLKILIEHLNNQYKRVIFTTFSLDYYDHVPKGQPSYNHFVIRINQEIKKLTNGYSKFVNLDIGKIIQHIGSDRFFDKKNEYFSHSLFTAEACDVLASTIVQILTMNESSRRKCLILDCDQVLWGGIVGEIGIERIDISRQNKGKAFRDFQREIVKLARQGVLIALCSKNDEEEIWNVLENHPDILLKRKYITTHRINWNDKANNIAEILTELNILPECAVYMDDNSYETGRIREVFPEILTITLDPHNPHTYPLTLKELKCFRQNTLTHEDHLRVEMYQKQFQREKIKRRVTSIHEYHKMLQTRTKIVKATEKSVARISELSIRTNQFNLSARRYTEGEIMKIVRAQDHEIWCLSASDKFGDLGMVGAFMLRVDNDRIVIEAFFLSCRVFGRGFEHIMMKAIRNRAKRHKKKDIYGVYVPTKKNARFSKFFEENRVINDGV